MKTRRLGRTLHESTIVTFGEGGVGRQNINPEVADEAVELIFEHGVNHIDIAPHYGHAMEALQR